MSARLVLTFAGTNGDAVFSYSYADQNVEDSDVATLMQTMITNGSIFTNPPLAAKSAKIVSSTEREIDLTV